MLDKKYNIIGRIYSPEGQSFIIGGSISLRDIKILEKQLTEIGTKDYTIQPSLNPKVHIVEQDKNLGLGKLIASYETNYKKLP